MVDDFSLKLVLRLPMPTTGATWLPYNYGIMGFVQQFHTLNL